MIETKIIRIDTMAAEEAQALFIRLDDFA